MPFNGGIKLPLIRTSTGRRIMVRKEIVELNENELTKVIGGQDGWGVGAGHGLARGGGVSFQSPVGSAAVGWGTSAAVGIGAGIGPSGGGVGVGYAATNAVSFAAAWPNGAIGGGFGNYNAGGIGAGW